jgi:FKBP-type peptidyl-prolyl cis-trans isomerase FkpA
MSRLSWFVCVAGLVFTAACGGSSSDSPTAPTPRAEFSITDLRAGTGTAASNGRLVTVSYTGWFYSPSATEQKGARFDGNPSYPFTLGTGGVIRGWDLGVVGMRVGGLRRLVIPPELAYGSTGSQNGGIPPNATLVFDVELLNVQ